MEKLFFSTCTASRLKRALRSSFFILHSSFFILFASCNPAKNFVVIDLDAPRMQGLTMLRGEAVVENDGGRNLIVERAELTIHINGRKVATAALVEPIRIPRKEVSRVDYRLKLSSVSLGALGVLSLDDADGVTVDIDATVRLGRVNKKIKLKKVPLSEILHNFAP